MERCELPCGMKIATLNALVSAVVCAVGGIKGLEAQHMSHISLYCSGQGIGPDRNDDAKKEWAPEVPRAKWRLKSPLY